MAAVVFLAALFFAALFFAGVLPDFFTAGRDALFAVDVVFGATSGEANGRSVTERHGVHDEDLQFRHEVERRIRTSTQPPPHAFLPQDSE